MADNTNRKSGTIEVQVGGVVQDAIGNFSYNLGYAKREALVGADKVHGYKEMPQAPMIEGELRDRGNLDMATIMNATNIVVILTLANGKVFTLTGAFYTGDGNIGTEEGNIEVKFEGLSADETNVV